MQFGARLAPYPGRRFLLPNESAPCVSGKMLDIPAYLFYTEQGNRGKRKAVPTGR